LDANKIKQEPDEGSNLLDQLDAVFAPTSGKVNVETEPRRNTLYRKRQSTEPLLEENTERPAGLSEGSSFKKPKLEVHKAPLGPADLNKTPLVFVPPVAVSPEEARVKIEEVQSQIANTQTMLDRIRRLSKPSKRDIQNENAYVARILGLKGKKEELKASIPAAAPVPMHNKPSTQMFKMWSPKKSGPVASGSNVKLKTELDRDTLGGQRLSNSFMNEPLGQDPSARATLVTSGSGPSGSDLKTSALGSWEPEADRDGDDSTDNEKEVLPDVMQRLAGFMPMMGPIRDPYDENGDFHGRGRDTWVGPQAKADE
jgi:hypothetical protein